jgi:hypothetical protein
MSTGVGMATGCHERRFEGRHTDFRRAANVHSGGRLALSLEGCQPALC